VPAKPPSKALVNKALHGELTRANTKPGTTARKAVYRSEYIKRGIREQRSNVSYPQARRLREAFPLTAPSRAELKRNHKDVTLEHTRYAIIRAQVITAQISRGKKVGNKKAKASRAAGRLPPMQYPTAALAAWYRNAWGSDYDPRAFSDVAGGPEGPPRKGERIAEEEAIGGGYGEEAIGGGYGEEAIGGGYGAATEDEEAYRQELSDYAEGEGFDTEGIPFDTYDTEDYYGAFDDDEWDVWEFGEY
jgi:hypothetical protein